MESRTTISLSASFSHLVEGRWTDVLRDDAAGASPGGGHESLEYRHWGEEFMAKQFACIEARHHDFILQQRIFFAASAAAEGRVNVSPKDGAALRILGPNRVAYLDQTGSGNETAAHLRANGRLTL